MRKDLWRNKRGLSTVVGSVFIVLIIMLGMNSFMWQMLQHNDYQMAAAEVNSSDQERVCEDLAFQYPGVTGLNGTGPYLFKILVNNNCPLDIQTVRIYIYDKTNSTLTILDPKTPSSTYGFENGYIRSAKFNHEIQVYSPIEPDDENEYELRLVTERGRLFTTLYPMPLTNVFANVQQSQVVYSANSLKVGFDNSSDWWPPYASAANVTSGKLYMRAVFGNSGTSPIVLSTDSVLLSQISDATANDKVYYIGGHLIDPATKEGWPGSLTVEPGTTGYLYFHIDSWNIPSGDVMVFTGSAGLVGTKDGEFWSGAILMDAFKITG